MSKIENGGLDQYGAEPFERHQFGTAGAEGVKMKVNSNLPKCYNQEVTRPLKSIALLIRLFACVFYYEKNRPFLGARASTCEEHDVFYCTISFERPIHTSEGRTLFCRPFFLRAIAAVTTYRWRRPAQFNFVAK